MIPAKHPLYVNRITVQLTAAGNQALVHIQDREGLRITEAVNQGLTELGPAEHRCPPAGLPVGTLRSTA
jgi:hypothetical protein